MSRKTSPIEPSAVVRALWRGWGRTSLGISWLSATLLSSCDLYTADVKSTSRIFFTKLPHIQLFASLLHSFCWLCTHHIPESLCSGSNKKRDLIQFFFPIISTLFAALYLALRGNAWIRFYFTAFFAFEKIDKLFLISSGAFADLANLTLLLYLLTTSEHDDCIVLSLCLKDRQTVWAMDQLE